MVNKTLTRTGLTLCRSIEDFRLFFVRHVRRCPCGYHKIEGTLIADRRRGLFTSGSRSYEQTGRLTGVLTLRMFVPSSEALGSKRAVRFELKS